MDKIIFCPNCGRFFGAQEKCKNCGWTRPLEKERIGKVCWTVEADESTAPNRKPPFPARYTQSEELLFIPTDNGEIIAIITETGEIRWHRKISEEGGLRTLALSLWREFLLIGGEHLSNLPDTERHFWAFHTKTGQDAWFLPVNGDNLSVSLIEEDIAYFASSEPRLYALNLITRSLLWSVPSLPWSPEPAAISGKTIVVPSRGPSTAAYDIKNGRRLWSFQVDDPEMETLHQRPAVSDSSAYLSGWGRKVYAVDLLTGKLQWQYKAERGVTCSPLLYGNKLLVCIKSFRHAHTGAVSGPGYGMVALDTDTGKQAWVFPTEKHIYTCPFLADQTVVFGTDDGSLYALDVETGEERWHFMTGGPLRSGPFVMGNRVMVGDINNTFYAIQWKEEILPPIEIASLISEGRITEAAAEMALLGQYESAARMYVKSGLLENAAALFIEANLPGEAAEVYIELNALDKALALRQYAGDRSGEAKVLSLLGNHNEAALILEDIGSLEQAAEEYVAAGRAGQGAKLLLKAGHFEEAAILFQSINDHDRAAEALVEAGCFYEAAEIYRTIGKLESAASILVQGGMLAEAAALNEQIGKLADAAQQYRQCGQAERALPIFESLQDWESVFELSNTTGDLSRAADALTRLGRYDQAAVMYERAGKLNVALERYEFLKQWEKAARIAGELNHWEQQAELLLQAGLLAQAGEAYLRGADQLLQKEPAGKEPAATTPEETASALARMYELAAKCFLEADDGTRYAECWDKVCQYRQWPNIQGEFDVVPQFYQGEYSLVRLVLRNTGYGIAKNIDVQKTGSKFLSDETGTHVPIYLLGPQKEKNLVVPVKPRSDVLGQVILSLTLGYLDITGKEYEFTMAQNVRVLSQDEKHFVQESTPFPDELKDGVIGDIDLIRLRQGLAEYFNEDDFRDLCYFDLKIDYESLPGATKSAKARELILHLGRRGRLNELLEVCRKHRPRGNW